MRYSALRGVEEMRSRLRKISTGMAGRVEASIYKRAQIIMTEAKRRCPVAPDGGVLRASGYVAEPVRSGRKISVTLSFGGVADAYAVAVHEHLSEHSPPSWIKAEKSEAGVHWTQPGTGPKFLEGPINEAMTTMASDIASDIHLDKER